MKFTPHNELQTRELCAALWQAAQKLGWSEAQFKRFVVGSMQTISYDQKDFFRCDVRTLEQMKTRLAIAGLPALVESDRAEFWTAAKLWKVDNRDALAIETAWSSEGVTDWAGAMEELRRRFEIGQLSQAA